MLSIRNKSKDYRPPFRGSAFVFAVLIGGGLLLFLTSGDNRAAMASRATGNVNAAERGALVPQVPIERSTGSDYVVTSSTGATIVPGTVRTPMDCSINCSETIDLPFPFTLYDRTFTTAIVGSNGILGVRQQRQFLPTKLSPQRPLQLCDLACLGGDAVLLFQARSEQGRLHLRHRQSTQSYL